MGTNEALDRGAKGVCFMVTPFGKRKTGAGDGAPGEVDFDQLWAQAFEPALVACGYEPVRGDQDWGPLILKDIFERLTLASLVLADLTVENGNVYYEVGVRHAVPGRHHCVLMAADWATPKFDLGGARQVRYPLPKGEVGAAHYAAIRDMLIRDIPKYARSPSLLETLVPGYPEPRIEDAGGLKAWVARIQEFQLETREIRALSGDARKQRTLALREEWSAALRAGNELQPSQAMELLELVRDFGGWRETLELIELLPEELKSSGYVREQEALALGKSDRVELAIQKLEALIASSGESAERRGLLGGRYKTLAKQHVGTPRGRGYLKKAIENYERGTYLDLNDYYPSCNLPRLYRQRGDPGDAERAAAMAQLVVFACERARRRDENDEWLRPTLLGAAFDAGDVQSATRYVEEIEEQGGEPWKLDTTLADLRRASEQQASDEVRAELAELVTRLEAVS